MTEPRDLAAEYADLDYPDRDPYPRRWIPSWLILVACALNLSALFVGPWWLLLIGSPIVLAALRQEILIRRWWNRNPS